MGDESRVEPIGEPQFPVIPISNQVEAQVGAQVKAQVEAQVEMEILAVCLNAPMSSAEIATALGHKQLSGNLRKALPRLRVKCLLEYTIPNKPNSRLQQYRLTEKGSNMLALLKGDKP